LNHNRNKNYQKYRRVIYRTTIRRLVWLIIVLISCRLSSIGDWLIRSNTVQLRKSVIRTDCTLIQVRFSLKTWMTIHSILITSILSHDHILIDM